MASASLLKSSPVLDKSEFVKGHTLRQTVVRCFPNAVPSSLSVRASSYADELVKTAVCIYFYFSELAQSIQYDFLLACSMNRASYIDIFC